MTSSQAVGFYLLSVISIVVIVWAVMLINKTLNDIAAKMDIIIELLKEQEKQKTAGDNKIPLKW